MPELTYLDYNATAPIRPEAAAAVRAALGEGGNPSSVHRSGRAARQRVEAARAEVAHLVNATPAQVVFTAGASEANNLALRGLGAKRVLASAIEHDSVLAARDGVETVPVGPDGRVDLAALDVLLAKGDAAGTLVSVMWVNNETGIIQQIEEIASRVHAAGARLHVDAVQAAGRIPVDFNLPGMAAMSLSAHKIGGPAGAGALILAEGVGVEPIIRGGGHERRRRAGTENLLGIAGFGAAAKAAGDTRAAEDARLQILRKGLEDGIRTLSNAAVIIGSDALRVANTCCVALPGITAEKQVMALDLAGVAVSAGSACSSGKVVRSHVLDAMGLGEEVASAAIRVSLGWNTTEADIARFLTAYEKLAAKAAA